MSKQIIDLIAFRKSLKAVAKKGQLFHDTALQAVESGPKSPLTKKGLPTKAGMEHIQAFRDLLNAKGEDTARQDWADAGQPDGSYRGYVTHMANAIVGVWVSGDAAAEMTFNALAKAGKDTLKPAKPPADKDDPKADAIAMLLALVAAGPRDDAKASKWERQAMSEIVEVVNLLEGES